MDTNWQQCTRLSEFAQLWWQHVAKAASGEKTPQQALDGLAAAQDQVLKRFERSDVQGETVDYEGVLKRWKLAAAQPLDKC